MDPLGTGLRVLGLSGLSPDPALNLKPPYFGCLIVERGAKFWGLGVRV